MSDRNKETRADITAEMREYAKPFCVGGDMCSKVACPATISLWADRIDAATEAERFQIRQEAFNEAIDGEKQHCIVCKRVSGQAAAMREALLKASDVLKESAHHLLTEEYINECLALIHVALSKPARNCDVYETEIERQAAFIEWYNEAYGLKGSKDAISSCDLKHNVNDILHDYIDWLFATTESKTKGGTDESR